MALTRFTKSPFVQDCKFSKSSFAPQCSVDGEFKTEELGSLPPAGTVS